MKKKPDVQGYLWHYAKKYEKQLQSDGYPPLSAYKNTYTRLQLSVKRQRALFNFSKLIE